MNRLKATLPEAQAGRVYELARGLLLADLRCDGAAINEVLGEMGIDRPHEIFAVLCVMAHARTAAVKLAEQDAHEDGQVALRDLLLDATRTNVVLRTVDADDPNYWSE